MPPIFETLIQPADRVIAITGAGGKTSLMFLLARAFCRQGHAVITTTSTRILIPKPSQSAALVLVTDNNFSTILEKRLKKHGHVTVANQMLPGNKLEGCTPEALRKIFQQSSAKILIIEADGARGLPLKAPGANEPVVPAWADVCIALVGLDIIGKKLCADTVFRPEQITRITGIAEDSIITPESIAQLSRHSQGLRKGWPDKSRQYIFLNKADIPDGYLKSLKVVESANTAKKNPLRWVSGSIRNNNCTLLG